VKITHAIDFLCEDMKVKITLKFRGREMAHTEFGFQVVQKFLTEIAPFGHPDFQPKLIGKGINVMISPLPRNKRAKNPRQIEGEEGVAEEPAEDAENHQPKTVPAEKKAKPPQAEHPKDGFVNNPLAQIETK